MKKSNWARTWFLIWFFTFATLLFMTDINRRKDEEIRLLRINKSRLEIIVSIDEQIETRNEQMIEILTNQLERLTRKSTND